MLNKKGFTLFELIIVIIIVSIALSFLIPKFNTLDNNPASLSLNNIKSYLSKINYENRISIKCTQDDFCFLYIDDMEQDKKLLLNIDSSIEVYEYDNKLTKILYNNYETKDFRRYDIIFELSIDNDKKHKDFIVNFKDKVYIFNSIFNTPIILDSISDVNDYFYNLKNEGINSAL